MFDQFLSNESRFGRLMTRLGILMAANLMFLISCIPVVTAGAGLCALHHTLLKTLRGDGEINPFVQFLLGFKRNFRQATAAFLLLLMLAVVLTLEIFWCSQFTGPVAAFSYGLYAIAMVALVLALYLFPTMAAFDAPAGQQLCLRHEKPDDRAVRGRNERRTRRAHAGERPISAAVRVHLVHDRCVRPCGAPRFHAAAAFQALSAARGCMRGHHPRGHGGRIGHRGADRA